MRQYYVYVLSSRSRTLYIGVTSDLYRRMGEHKQTQVKDFTAKYNVTELVYYEVTDDPIAAITREKQLKRWLRARKIALVESVNPNWEDLAADWGSRDSSLRSK